jgi:hypothetical protein
VRQETTRLDGPCGTSGLTARSHPTAALVTAFNRSPLADRSTVMAGDTAIRSDGLIWPVARPCEHFAPMMNLHLRRGSGFALVLWVPPAEAVGCCEATGTFAAPRAFSAQA